MDLAAIERRLAALHQEKKFNPRAPWYVLFTPEEMKAMLNQGTGDGRR